MRPSTAAAALVVLLAGTKTHGFGLGGVSLHAQQLQGRCAGSGTTRRCSSTRIASSGAAGAAGAAGRMSMKTAASAEPDYIIIGGGTAGCVLANRLTEDKTKNVVVLEAGGAKYNDKKIKVPVGILRLFKSAFDWDFTSQNEKSVSTSSGGIYLGRGKVLGGSSCMNVMLYHRGQESDYDSWGVEGWEGKNLLQYFTKAENNKELGKHKYHGNKGPIHVENPRYKNKLTKMFFDACLEAGFSFNEDFNNWDSSQEGFGKFQLTQKGGRRCSAASSYLKQASGRKNLSTITEAHTTKLVMEGPKVVGVEYISEGERKVVKVAPGGEVILAAGAIQSPQLLMLSGIGPKEHLESLGIPVVKDLPGVGENMQDHPAVTVATNINKAISITDDLFKKGTKHLKATTIAKWLLAGRGPMAAPGCENGGFFKTSGDKSAPDVQIRFVPGRGETADGVSAYTQIGNDGQYNSGVTFQVIAARPKARGTVKLQSKDPLAKPLIQTNYLEDSEDVATLSSGIGIARTLLKQGAFGNTVEDEVFPGKEVSDEAGLTDYVRKNVHSANAVVGTCKMGTASDAHAVVDSSLRVFGVPGLRVVDASIMPTIPGGQTGAPTIMIAEKAAAMLAAA